MEDSSQRLIILAKLGHESLHVRRRANIRLGYAHLHAAGPKVLNEGFSLRAGCAAAAGQDEVAGAGFDEPSCDDLSKSSKCSGDQIGAVRLDCEPRRKRFSSSANESV